MFAAATATAALAGQPVELTLADGSAIALDSSDVIVQFRAAEGWTGVVDGATQVAVDTRITEELAEEGMARDVVRHVQELRKKAELEPEDRIALYLQTDSTKLRSAINAYREYICNEALAVEWSQSPLGVGAHSVDKRIDGQALHIELKRLDHK